jgi:hypothetical protein
MHMFTGPPYVGRKTLPSATAGGQNLAHLKLPRSWMSLLRIRSKSVDALIGAGAQRNHPRFRFNPAVPSLVAVCTMLPQRENVPLAHS